MLLKLSFRDAAAAAGSILASAPSSSALTFTSTPHHRIDERQMCGTIPDAAMSKFTHVICSLRVYAFSEICGDVR